MALKSEAASGRWLLTPADRKTFPLLSLLVAAVAGTIAMVCVIHARVAWLWRILAAFAYTCSGYVAEPGHVHQTTQNGLTCPAPHSQSLFAIR